MDIRSGILSTANALQMNPLDLATIISYETGGTFDPLQKGPTTKWGQHRGLIQFGEPQARQYGVDWDNPLASQLGPNGAVANYFRSSGWKPGMGLLDGYSIVNAGGPGLYDRSDAHAGGAPGTVRDKVEGQMAGHREKAAALLGMPVETISTQGSVSMDQKPKTKFQQLQDKGFFDNAAMAFNSLRMRPDPNIAQIGMMRQQQRQEQGRKSRTAEWLRANGREDLASAVEAGLDAKAALGAALQPPERQGQVVSAEQLRQMFPGAKIEDGLYSLKPDGTASKVGGGGVNVTLPGELSGEEELRKKLLGKQGETLNNIVEAGRISSQIVPDLEALASLAEVGPSGPIEGRLAEMFPEFNDVAAARQAIIRRVAPQMRAEGSGSTSDIEYAGMVESLGRLTNRPEANVAIAEMMIAKARLDQQRAALVQQYTMGAMKYDEMTKELQKLDSVSIMPPSLKRLIDSASDQGGQGDGATDDGIPTFDPETGTWK